MMTMASFQTFSVTRRLLIWWGVFLHWHLVGNKSSMSHDNTLSLSTFASINFPRASFSHIQLFFLFQMCVCIPQWGCKRRILYLSCGANFLIFRISQSINGIFELYLSRRKIKQISLNVTRISVMLAFSYLWLFILLIQNVLSSR